MAAGLGLSVSSRSSNKVRLRGGAEVLEPCAGNAATVREAEVGEKAKEATAEEVRAAESCAPGARLHTHRGDSCIPRRGVGAPLPGNSRAAATSPPCQWPRAPRPPMAEGQGHRAATLVAGGRVRPAMDGGLGHRAAAAGAGLPPPWLPRRRAGASVPPP
ncbi:unnamed protein product [Miscanthus lutarioriparius]|uniref:Uncharacterized protein n=1 Tax=Miscanthus lutarioriparius TaxID=422564 RepID=A0A811P393_9POAL|nr:unnamed protein product [Miscanthus lutarioriparius]